MIRRSVRGRKTIKSLVIPALLAAVFVAPTAHAAIDLIAMGSLSGSSAGSFADLSGLTGVLENGVAANNLGGIGSGLAWAGGNTFIATPDRGPNATSFNALVDDTSSYVSRFQTVDLALTANNSGTGLAYNLTPTLTATTLLSSTTPLTYGSGAGLGNQINGTPLGSGAPSINTASLNYFTGRSDNFNPLLPSGNPNNARLDPEGVRVSNDGRSVFVSDEYGPYVYQFDRATGQRIKSFALPANLAIANLSAQGSVEIANNTTGRVANKGMEGLAITPDGKTLVGIMQAPLEQDAKKNLRIVTIDIATGATHEYGYKLTTGSGVSEIVALNDHQFLIDERDGSGLGNGDAAVVKQVFMIDLTGAVDVSGQTGTLSAVSKVLVLDLVSVLNAHGIASNQIPAKIEGMSFGQDVMVNGVLKHTIYFANDNDFVPGTAGANNFYVFAASDAELGAIYQAQQIAAVPEPQTYALMLAGLGLIGCAARRMKTKPSV